jgi:hypothetical protein
LEKLIAAGYLAICFAIVMMCLRAGERMFHVLKGELSTETWRELGSPSTLWDVFAHPSPNWRAMIRDRTYESECSPEARDRIKGERRYIFRLFSVALALGAVYVVWVLLR